MKPFSADGSLHDLTSYSGRMAHFFDMVDLRNAFVSPTDVTAATSLLAAHRAGLTPPGTTDESLWAAKKSECTAFVFLYFLYLTEQNCSPTSTISIVLSCSICVTS